MSALPTIIGVVAAAGLLAGCAGDRVAGGVTGSIAPARASPAPVDLPGRWAFSASGGSTCAMNLAGGAPASEGAIRPEGGCPGNFFTSRKWTFENEGLVIRDHNSQVLAQLRLVAPGRYEGQSSSGQPVSLVR